MTTETYRPEIDGLRAVAVGAVLLFHADAPGFSGGYLGVDIFFVISGYLITRIILREQEAGRFSFARFYLRRLRRLGPALLATIAATLVAGAFLLTPEHMRSLGASAAFAAASASNVYFWLQSGYFDTSAIYKPLLHTWSLGVEEQFYFVWPALILIMLGAGRQLFWPLIAVLGLVSLLAAEARIGAHAAEVFFHFPYRVSEFAIGALAVWASPKISRAPQRLREALTAVGLAAIIAAVFSYDEGSRVPGLAALPPALAAALIILGGDGWTSRALLQNPVSVFVGRISYSLYLVHWPVVVFYKYAVKEDFGAADILIVLGLSVALGWFSFRFIETPFRRPGAGALRPKSFAAAAIGGLLLAGAAGAHAWKTNGWPWRLDNDVSTIAASLPEMKNALFARAIALDAETFPRAGATNAVILGDSYGANLLNALTLAGSRAHFRHFHIQWMCGLYFGDRAHAPGASIPSPEEAARCEEQAEQLRDNASLEAADIILITSTWSTEAAERFPALLDYLKGRYRARIVLFGPRYFFVEPNDIIRNFETFEAANARFDAARREAPFAATDAALRAAAAKSSADYVELQSLVCEEDGERLYCPLFTAKRDILYFDWHHWSPAAEAIAGRRLKDSGALGELF